MKINHSTGKFIYTLLIYILCANMANSQIGNTNYNPTNNPNNYGKNNTAYGDSALFSLANKNFYELTYNNTAIGAKALKNNTEGFGNTSIGSYSLYNNLNGGYNTAIGFNALRNNNAASNVAIGTNALYSNSIGENNIAIGGSTLASNTSGKNNTAVGSGNLYSNISGSDNSTLGYASLINNTTGSFNIAIGTRSLFNNKNGNYNIAIGDSALLNNTSGSFNIALGDSSMLNNSTGSYNTAIGHNTRISSSISTSLVNATAIGNGAVSDANNKIRIGNTMITSIGGQVGWTKFSDGRYKENIKENVPGLAFIRLLRPVTYHIKQKELNDKIYGTSHPMKNNEKKPITETGFLAQEVEKAAMKAGYDFSGVDKPEDPSASLYGLRYDEFVVPLVKAVQELAGQNDSLIKSNTELEKRINKIETLIKEYGLATSSNENSPYAISATLANKARLEQNIPNPFSNNTSIDYFIPEYVNQAVIQVTDLNGRALQSISINKKGNGRLLLNTAQLTTGTYYYSLLIDGQVLETRKMLLNR